jgi:hypothetical protein
MTQDSLKVSLNKTGQFVTHQKLQRYENERFRIELEAQNAKKRLERSSQSHICSLMTSRLHQAARLSAI